MQFGDYGSSPFFFAAQVKVFVKAEGRTKENEIIVGRPDILHTVGYRKAESMLDFEVVLVREFRSPGRTADGFIREIPGGSAYEKEAPSISAAREFSEETGISIDPQRLRSHGTRQLAGTSAVQAAHLFSVELTLEEMEQARRDAKSGLSKGVAEEDERTYLEVYTLAELLQEPLTDWANLGMLMEVLMRDR
jgi:8-oxo-dGTP pyrophosphatase MutT (NUDIX family)